MENLELKIIDFEVIGNVIKLFLGDKDDDEYYGDDWNDCPYEHNAGIVYDRYIKGWIEVAFPLDFVIMAPEFDGRYYGNSPYCKNDFKGGKAPCIVIHKITEEEENSYVWVSSSDYSQYMSDKNSTQIYFNDIVTFDESGNVMADFLNDKERLIDYYEWVHI